MDSQEQEEMKEQERQHRPSEEAVGERVDLGALARARLDRQHSSAGSAENDKNRSSRVNDQNAPADSQSMLDRLKSQNKEPMIRHESELSDKRGGEEVKIDADLSARSKNAGGIGATTKKEPEPQQARKETAPAAAGGGAFECNICLDSAAEPVVTPCGHLFCWKCIYEWLQQPRDTLVCPVCKSGITKEKLIPIFTKESDEDPRKATEIPNRPHGQRSDPEPNNRRNEGGLFGSGLIGGNGGFVMGLGLFPPLFMLNFTWDDIFGASNEAPGGQHGGPNSGNPEANEESTLSRMLTLMIFFFILSTSLFGSDVFIAF